MAWTIVTVVVGVPIIGVLLYYAVSWALQSADRAGNDPKYRRKLLFFGGVSYVILAVFLTLKVLARKESAQSLLGLPMGATIAWLSSPGRN